MIKVNKIDLHMVCKTWECQIASSAVKMFLDTAARCLSLSFCSQELTKLIDKSCQANHIPSVTNIRYDIAQLHIFLSTKI